MISTDYGERRDRVTLTNAVVWRSDFSPQPNGHCNRAESCDYKKEDAPYAADTYERFYSLNVHVDAPPGATSTCELARIQRGLYYAPHAPST